MNSHHTENCASLECDCGAQELQDELESLRRVVRDLRELIVSAELIETRGIDYKLRVVTASDLENVVRENHRMSTVEDKLLLFARKLRSYAKWDCDRHYYTSEAESEIMAAKGEMAETIAGLLDETFDFDSNIWYAKNRGDV